MGCKCSRNGNGFNNNNFEEDYYSQKKENEELRKTIKELKLKIQQNKINNIPFKEINRAGSNSTISSKPGDTIQVLFNDQQLDLQIKKEKDTIAKIIERFGEKYKNQEYQGICFYKGKRIMANKKFNELDFSNDDQLIIT